MPRLTARPLQLCRKLFAVGLALAALASPPGLAEPEPDPTEPGQGGDLASMSLEELLNLPVSVAASKARAARDTPGVVSRVSREEILRSGARDLIDILRLVPGFSPAVDVQGVVDMGFRGNWAHEGKIQLLIDGQEMNEQLFATLQLGNHFPVTQIESVEVLRGPGSSIYGGNAELAVINVKTRAKADLNEAAVVGAYGFSPRSFNRRNVTAIAGKHWADGGIQLLGMLGQGNRSDDVYFDPNTPAAVREDQGNFRVNPRFLEASGQYKNHELRVLLDDYLMTDQDGLGTLIPSPLGDRMDFWSLNLDERSHFEPTERLSLGVRLNYKQQSSWRVSNPDSLTFYDKTYRRYTGRLTATYRATDNLQFLVGGEAARERAELNQPPNQGLQVPMVDGRLFVLSTDLVGFGEADYDTPIGHFLVGLRVENDQKYNAALSDTLAPRFAYTLSVDKAHLKLLAARSFRAPAFENISANPDIKPEMTNSYEAEVGYQAGLVYGAINLFDTTILRPIIFGVMPGTSNQLYFNQGRSHTRGIEADLRTQSRRITADLNYSFYRAVVGPDSPQSYVIGTAGAPVNSNEFLGMPAHKIALSAIFRATDQLALTPSVIYSSARSTYGDLAADGTTPILVRLDGQLLANLNLTWDDAGVKGLNLSAGVFNAFNTADPYPQPYNTGTLHAPLKGPRREILFRLSYAVGL